MTQKRILSMILCLVMLMCTLPLNISAADTDKTLRTVYLHAQGENAPEETTNISTVYMGENADIYFAVDNPNKGEYINGVHTEPQYDLNGYTLRICFDPAYFDYVGNNEAPIDYAVPDANFDTSDKDEEDAGDDTVQDVPQSVGYFVYEHGSGSYSIGLENYKTAYALKRLDYIRSIFDDNAVIVTGKVVTRLDNEAYNDGQAYNNNRFVELTRQSKEQYMRNLERCFESNEYINIRFANNDIIRTNNEAAGETYGIQIKQDYYSSNYGDTGYLFLMVDLNDPKKPIIKVRAWQPERDPNFGEDGLIDLADF